MTSEQLGLLNFCRQYKQHVTEDEWIFLNLLLSNMTSELGAYDSLVLANIGIKIVASIK